MAGRVYDWPQTTDGDPEILPWATAGTTLEPALAQENVGWQAAGVGPPPDYRLVNYQLNRQMMLNRRDLAGALFVEYPEGDLQLGGVAAGVNSRRITINGINTDYMDQVGDTLLMVTQALATLINANPALRILVYAEANVLFPGLMSVVSKTPGQVFTLAVAVLAGAGTIVVNTPPATAIVRAPGGVVSPTQFNHVIGSTSTEDTGNPVEDARIVWDKVKGAFRAGRATGMQWDDAFRGMDSIAMGLDCTAVGTSAVCLGAYCSAGGNNSVCLGGASIASGADSVAIGESNSATGQGACAIGSGCTASANFSTAVGQGATAAAQNALALGMGNAQGLGSVAIGGSGFNTADALDEGDIAIGAGALADNNAGARPALAVGESATATAEDAVAIGNGALANTLRAVALGRSAAATGRSALAGPESNSAAETGTALNKGTTTAGQTSQLAAGENCVTSGAGARATGKGGSTAMVAAIGNGAAAHGYNPVDSALRATIASGACADAQGESVVASADFARASGKGAKATNIGECAHGSVYDEAGVVLDAKARHQYGKLISQVRVDPNDPLTMLCPDSTNGTGAATWTPIDDRGYAVRVQAVAKSEVSNKARFWDFTALVTKDAGVVAFAGGAQLLGAVGIVIGAAANIQPVAELGGWAWGGGAAEGPQLQIAAVGGTIVISASGTPPAGEAARLTAKIDYTLAGLDY